MAPVNPYLRKPSKKSVAAAAPPPASTASAKNTQESGTKTMTKSLSAPKPKPPVTMAPPQHQIPGPAGPKTRPAAVTPAAAINMKVPRQSVSAAVASTKRPTPAMPPSSLSVKQPKSFKSKLKQQIESLKRAKQMEKQRKIMEQQNKRLEKERREQLMKQQQEQQILPSQDVQGGVQQQGVPVYRPKSVAQRQAAMTQPVNYAITPAKTSNESISQVNQGRVSNNPMLASVASVPQVTPAACVTSKQTPSPAALESVKNSDGSSAPTPLKVQSNLNQGQSCKDKVNNVNAVPVVAKSGPLIVKSNVSVPANVDSRNNETTPEKVMMPSEMPPYQPVSHEYHPHNAQLPPSNLAAPTTFAAPMQYGAPPPPPFAPASFPPTMMLPPAHAGYIPPFGWHPYQQQAMMMNMMDHPAAWSQHAPSIPALKHVPARAPTDQPQTLKTPATAVLHHQPLHPVSPYADTHELLGGEIPIFKSLGGSFGVSFKYETRSALLDAHVAGSLTDGGQLDANNLNQASATPANKEDSVVSTKAVSAPTLPVNSNVSTSALDDDKTDETAKQRRPRRRRVFFGVLMVVTAEKQNSLFKRKDQLQPGDVVLKINGHALGGLTFQQAIALFASCDSRVDAAPTAATEGDSPSLICCPLVVARMKTRPTLTSYNGIPGASSCGVSVSKHQQQSLKVPFVVNSISDQVVSGDFTSAELMALAQAALHCLSTESRALGHVAPSHVELASLQIPGLAQRDLSSIKSKQNHFIRSVEQAMKKAASDHWASQWKLEQERTGGSDTQFTDLSDAERSALRERPRPLSGCRCGSANHEFVDDSKCVLYSNLRMLSDKRVDAGEKPEAPKKAKASQLNAVATANKERMIKLKEATEREEKEAQFVEDMEGLQVKKLKMAVFVPSLTSMVLSAVAKVAKSLSGDDLIFDQSYDRIASNESERDNMPTSDTIYAEPASFSKESSKTYDSKPDDEDGDDDDDDVPLMELSKRSAPSSSQEPNAKRLKTVDTSKSNGGIDGNNKQRPVNLSFMAKVLRHISRTWGHLFTEPSDLEYCWRWEVYHGQTASSGNAYQETRSVNARPVESRSFENIQFALTDEVLSRLAVSSMKQSGASQVSDVPLVDSSDSLLVTYLLSPKRTGVYDEIMALVKMGVLQGTRSGCFILAKGWQAFVDPLVLNDMEQRWSKRQDPMNKHCIWKSVRSKLGRAWMHVDGGWAMSADPDDVIFRDDDFDEWRKHFQARFESQINETEGIEKFGI